MLQQTTVGAVRGRYEAFLARFPDVASLAARARGERPGGVVGARLLRAGAKPPCAPREIVAREHGGTDPADPAVLRRLPGFGEYMAAAVASLAFGVRAAGGRRQRRRASSRGSSRSTACAGLAGAPRARARGDGAPPPRPTDPGDSIAAFMDLGQTICTAAASRLRNLSPSLGLRRRRDGRAGRAIRRRSRARRWSDRLRRRRRAEAAEDPDGPAVASGWLAGMWELPSAEGPTPEAAGARSRGGSSALGLRLELTRAAALRLHTIMRRRLEIEILPAAPGRPAGPANGARRAGSAGRARRGSVPTLTRKIVRARGFLPTADLTVSCEGVTAVPFLHAPALAASAASRRPAPPPMRLTLRNGTVYLLREPPRISGTRVIFTTRMAGRSPWTRARSRRSAPFRGRAATPRRYDSEDSHALGAIARQQREPRGKKAEVAPRPPVKRSDADSRHPTRRPAPSPPGPAAGKTSPG